MHHVSHTDKAARVARVEELIRASGEGIRVCDIMSATGYSEKCVKNYIHLLAGKVSFYRTGRKTYWASSVIVASVNAGRWPVQPRIKPVEVPKEYAKPDASVWAYADRCGA